jgi:hypothetical protein
MPNLLSLWLPMVVRPRRHVRIGYCRIYAPRVCGGTLGLFYFFARHVLAAFAMFSEDCELG